MRWSFMGLLKAEMDSIVKHRNTHKIRPNKNSEGPSGITDVLYFLPQNYGKIQYVLNGVYDFTQFKLLTWFKYTS